MSNKEQVIKKNYEENLKARDYHVLIHHFLDELPRTFELQYKFFHDVVHSGRFPGSKFLEVASGATVANIASASAVYSTIVQSDFAPDNCEVLKQWHRKESPLDWSRFLRIVAKLEGYEKDLKKGTQLLESRIRKSVKCVVRSDVLDDDVLPLDQMTADTKPPYDVVQICLALEAAVPDYDGYVAAIGRLAKLLRPGGGLIITGFEHGGLWKTYSSQEEAFYHVSLRVGQVIDALSANGFGNHYLKTLERENDMDYEFKSLFCVASEKLK